MKPYALFVAASVLLFGCTKLFQPTGDGTIPETEAVESELEGHVQVLAGDIGERNHFHQEAYERAAAYIQKTFEEAGYEVKLDEFIIPDKEEYMTAAGKKAVNLEVRKPGTDPNAPWLVVGAHYDTRVGMKSWHCSGPPVPGKTGTPGANDNGSGVAALLYLARSLRNVPTRNGIIFVAWANEEHPFFQNDEMGSRRHARALVKELGDEKKVSGAISLETMGIYSPRVNKKRRSALAGALVGILDRCDYVAFMSTNSGRRYSRNCAKVFASVSRFPVRSIVFGYLTRGIAWSDDWSYMKEGIPSFAITDTAYMRCDDYHETSDTPDKLDYREFAEVVLGVESMLKRLAHAQP